MTVLLAVIVVGERLSGGEAVAIAVTIVGVVLAGAELHRIARLERVAPLGLIYRSSPRPGATRP
ncbi:MAG TPA: hypothetical protein VH306_12130 [Gaiellaceae bacterium]